MARNLSMTSDDISYFSDINLIGICKKLTVQQLFSTWSIIHLFVVDDKVTSSDALIRYNDTVHKHGLITSTLGLQMTVEGRYFKNGPMRVKCLASISPVLWKGGRESIVQRRPGVIDNREAMLLDMEEIVSVTHTVQAGFSQ
uniref:Uncharacterized protein n=1 Tax=Megaselia scalaris TaxID=36166 RepID=T1GXM6_MEGSC